jgi:hypothetical protein
MRFRFSEIELDNITNLPKYQMGLSDLTRDALVTVGYTAATYNYDISGESGLALSLNIHFVLHHGFIA